MSFSPFARFRNFTLDNLKALLEVYPDTARTMVWSEAANEIEVVSPGYKRTAYQQACQFGLEDRGENRFRIQNYLYNFDDKNLEKYIEFWIKTYFAPNPYVKSEDSPLLIYCEIVKAIHEESNGELNYNTFFNDKIGGKSDDILLNAIKNYAAPVKVKKVNGEDILFIENTDIDKALKEVEYIEKNLPIGNSKDKREFFDRFSFKNFCGFFNINLELPSEKDDRLKDEFAGIDFCTRFQSDFFRNRIVFGAPGTGKSYTLNTEKDKLLGDNSFDYERVTFHPNYSYANFVGTYKPISEKDKEGNDTIRYEYVPGPFMRIYAKTLKNSKNKEDIKPFLLLIEEINRANVAAVFGEVFQLLDRNGDNISEYAIQATEDMKKYLAKELKCSAEDVSEIRIPDNMFIWATMNSADQGVFPMDTAFKRRWEFEYIGIDAEAEEVENYIIPIGNSEKRKYVKWNDLRVAINNILLSDECKVNEDKLLGPFFLSKNVLENALKNEDRFIKAFESKVIMYLFEDAVKMRPKNIFKGHEGKLIFSEICKTFERKGEGLFGIMDIKTYDKPVE